MAQHIYPTDEKFVYVVTGASASRTSVIVAELANHGDDAFNSYYWMQVVKNANNALAAPSGEIVQITDYVSATGTFTLVGTGFTANVEQGDYIKVLHESEILPLITHLPGVTQIFTKPVTSAANVGDVTLATVTTQPVYIEKLTVHSDGATTADLTNIAIYGGAGKAVTFISAAEGVRANIAAQDKQVSWPDLGEGAVYLPVGATIVATLAGTGATAVDLNVVVKFAATVSGGTLA